MHASRAAATFASNPEDVEIDAGDLSMEVVGTAMAIDARMAKRVSFLTMLMACEVLNLTSVVIQNQGIEVMRG